VGRLGTSPINSGPNLAFSKPLGGATATASASASSRCSAAKSQPSRAAQEGSHSVRLVAAEFPPALRLYVLILEAADSYRLNSNLIRYGHPEFM
jgi:hypothetical protein